MQSRVNQTIQMHYTSSDLGNAILTALEKAGKNINNLTPEDLAPIDEFHIRGRTATLELARAVGLDATKHVLDVGSGIGGTSRCLAKEFGCHVTGIDLTEEYCRAARMLSTKLVLHTKLIITKAMQLNCHFPIRLSMSSGQSMWQ